MSQVSAAAPAQFYIVTDDVGTTIAELFGGAVPKWACVIGNRDMLTAFTAGDTVLGVFYHNDARSRLLYNAFAAARAASGAKGLDGARMAGFARWRVGQGLAPHFAIADLDARTACVLAALDEADLGGRVVAGSQNTVRGFGAHHRVDMAEALR
ncbi:MAG: hypothetical protein U5K75_09000 [Ahrensia sp.]|nr:hypothetical protein [Ahrensia sp.]